MTNENKLKIVPAIRMMMKYEICVVPILIAHTLTYAGQKSCTFKQKNIDKQTTTIKKKIPRERLERSLADFQSTVLLVTPTRVLN